MTLARILTLVPGLLLAAGPALGCSSSVRPVTPRTDAGQLESDAGSVVRQCPGWQPSATGLTAADLDRYGEAGTTEINALFCNPLMSGPQSELVFFVEVTDHFDIPRSDLTAGSWVETDSLRTDGGVAWAGGDLTIQDHHVGGHLTLPRTVDGAELIGPDTTYLALHLNGIGSEPELVLRWERDFLR